MEGRSEFTPNNSTEASKSFLDRWSKEIGAAIDIVALGVPLLIAGAGLAAGYYAESAIIGISTAGIYLHAKSNANGPR